MYNLAYDYCSLVVLFILMFFYFTTPKLRTFQNRFFSAILVMALLICASDIASSNLLVYKPEAVWANKCFLALSALTLHLLPVMYVVYIGSIVYKDNNAKFVKVMRYLLIPGAVILASNIISPFVPFIFSYSVEEGYSRTNFFFVQMAVAVFYMVAAIVIMNKYSEKTAFIPRVGVFSYTVVTVAFSIVQFFFPDQVILPSACAISVIVMYMALQSPRLVEENMAEVERSRKAAEEANEAKAVFLANMSHEIRTPMNAICGMTYLLENTELKSEAREYVDTIQNASQSLLALINDILDYSKVDAGKMNISETEYRVDKLVKEAINMILPQVDREHVAFSVYLDSKAPMIARGDESKIKAIITNLLSNAVKFTDEGHILLHISSVQKSDNKIDFIIRVQDTGIGIREEDMGKLFLQFQQVDMAINRRKEGTGLGLPLVKSYCELMNGNVTVNSVFGEGSTFIATVEQEFIEAFPEDYKKEIADYFFVILESNPYVRKNIEKTLKNIGAEYTIDDDISRDTMIQRGGVNCCILYNESEYGDMVKKCDLSGLFNIRKMAMVDYDFVIPENKADVVYVRKPLNFTTVLDWFLDEETMKKKGSVDSDSLYFSDKTRIALVDDNKVNLKVTSAILKKFGISTTMFMSGYEVIDAIRAGKEYDLIFMDHMMPDMDGVETTQKIRESHLGNTTRVPIVALTANAVKGVETLFFDAGMNDVIFKPINIDEMKRVLIKWLPRTLRAEKPEEK